MITENYVDIQSLCFHYEVEQSLFDELSDYGLIEIALYESRPSIALENISEVEKIIRLYHELHMNMEGIDVVCNLLKKIVNLQHELADARNKLRFYEDL